MNTAVSAHMAILVKSATSDRRTTGLNAAYETLPRIPNMPRAIHNTAAMDHPTRDSWDRKLTRPRTNMGKTDASRATNGPLRTKRAKNEIGRAHV